MTIILIGGPDNQKVTDVKGHPAELFRMNGNERITYQRTPALIEGYPAYKFVEKEAEKK
jgi:hypothetical protein